MFQKDDTSDTVASSTVATSMSTNVLKGNRKPGWWNGLSGKTICLASA
jgi:hypothetical protein